MCKDAEGVICLELLTELLCNRATKRQKKLLYRVEVCMFMLSSDNLSPYRYMCECVCKCVCVKRANICIVISLQSVSHMQDSGEVEEEIQAIPLRAPSILMTETSEATTYDIIVEGASLAQSTDR